MADLRKELERIITERVNADYLEAAGMPHAVAHVAAEMFAFGNFTDRDAAFIREGYKRFQRPGFIKDGTEWEPQ